VNALCIKSPDKSVHVEGEIMPAGFQVSPDGSLAMLPGGFGLPVDLYKKMYPHQHQGIMWMWSLHDRNPLRGPATSGSTEKICGGILADDMGMGKTLQVVAFIAGLFHSELTEKAMIVAPVSLIPVWEQEFARWAPEVRVKTFHGTGKAIERAVQSVCKRGGVLLTSYGMCTNRPGQIGIDLSEEGSSKTPRETISWDVVVLDEGHKIKNPSTQVCKILSSVHDSESHLALADL
jgi:SNF2 family DNA or RNA helicase